MHTGNVFVLTLFTRIVIFALAAVSLNLIMGYGGMMSFGHAAYLGIGGYAVGILAAEGIGSGFVQWPVALLASALFALVIGALSLRTRGVYFIMITLAFAQMAYYVASGLSRYGGDDGLTIYKRSTFGGLINLSNRVQFYYLCLLCLFGGVFTWSGALSIRASASSCKACAPMNGACRRSAFPATRYRLVCFVISGTMCGLAGALLANNTDFISPAVMYWTRSGDLMVMVILGGMGSLFGPGRRRDRLSPARRISVAGHRILGDDHGAAAAPDRAVRARRHSRSAREVFPWLNRCSVSKISFAASAASSRPTISRSISRAGELHAIIGPNGAGKTTLISQLIGQLRPTAGTIRFAGEDITHLPAWRRSQLGLARSFQITSLLPNFTAADNVALAAQARDGHSFRFFGNVAQGERRFARPRMRRWSG